MRPKIFSVYLLELENNKLYSGSTLTDQIRRRYVEHCRGEGAGWTNKYKPIRILKTWKNLTSPQALQKEHEVCVQKIIASGDLDVCRGGRYNFTKEGPDSWWWLPKTLEYLR